MRRALLSSYIIEELPRVPVKAGQTIVVTMILGPDELAYYDTDAGDYLVEPGLYEIMVGPSSASETLLKTELLVR